MIKKDLKGRGLERLVAGLEYSQSAGATVTWDDTIDDRQFDVTVRFRFGLHDYLTVIECKDHKGKIPVEKVEAFITKSRTAGANRAVMVSTAGFQSGAIKAADANGIRLLVLTEQSAMSQETVGGLFRPVRNFTQLSFITGNGTALPLETMSGRSAFLVDQQCLEVSEAKHTPKRYIDQWSANAPELLLDKPNAISLPLP